MSSVVQTYSSSNFRRSFNELHDAVRLGKYSIVKKLVRNGVDINAHGRCGATPLHLAVKFGHLKIMDYLMKNGASSESRCSSQRYAGYTPLHFACELERLTCAKLLLKYGASVIPKNVNDIHPIHIAVTKLNVKMITLLLDNGADVNVRFCDNFFTRDGGVIPSALRNQDYTLLLHAINVDSVEVAKLLLKYGANVNDKVIDLDRTPLMEAAHRNNLQMVQLLLENGAFINDYDSLGGTTLFYTLIDHCAAYFKYVKSFNQDKKLELIKFLLNSGANVNAKFYNWTVLDVAVILGFRDIVRYLLYFTNIDLNVNNIDTLKLSYLADNRIIPDIQDDLEYIRNRKIEFIEIRYDLIFEWYRRHMIGIPVKDIFLEINNPEWYNYDVNQQEHEQRIILIKEQVQQILDRMKCERVYDSNISLFNILTNSMRSLVKLAFNKNLRAFCLDDYKDQYFMYYFMLKNRLNYAIKKSLLMEKASKLIYSLLYCQLPNDCCEQIVTYLNDDDLNLFIN